jgi:hypothetical protein
MAQSPTVEVNINGSSYFSIDINNLSGKTVHSEKYDVALILPIKAQFSSPGVLSAARLPNDCYLYTLKQEQVLFPFGWSSIKVELRFVRVPQKTETLTLRFFTELGFKDYEFQLIRDWVR